MEKATTLTDVIRRKVQGPIDWTPRMKTDFEDVKRALCNNVVVIMPDLSKTFIL